MSSHVYVNDTQVENCASVGLTHHSGTGTAVLECNKVMARGLRTALHINGPAAFGKSAVSYQRCRATFSPSPSLWGSAELSQPTVVANMKVSSLITVELTECDVRGAKYLSWNNRACYGGLKIVGGYYEIDNQIFKSKG
ncbi:hypothetical protein [Azohydromonas caseinilytica]|uniref:Uncharacterized protein n=1 Tax=Azohydromonas caseinilytica TaxID=2728836 RepID=A0A848FF11_9BURK|nr:hypothetical protein [Azohydromonas caseinilytica]NML17425.1 hypothetical protein [Azohydromonas caseinilytica]